MLNNSLVSPQFQNSPTQYPLPVPNPTQPISARQKIHVSNLPLNVTTQQLQQTFQVYGNIIDIRIIRKTPTGLPLHISCYAFIAFADNDAADKAIQDGRIGDWTVKPQIDKQAITKCKSRSRSRSQEKNKQVLTNGPITFLEPSPKIQIQLYVRELFVSGISKNYDELKIRQVIECENYRFFRNLALQRGLICILISIIYLTVIQNFLLYKLFLIEFRQIKLFLLIKKWIVFNNNFLLKQKFIFLTLQKDTILLEISKFYQIFSLSNEQHSKLSSVLFIFFPPNLNKKVDHAFLFEVIFKPLNKRYVRINNADLSYGITFNKTQTINTKQALQIRNYLQQHLVDLLGDSKCEVGIVSLPKMPMQPQQQMQQYQPIQMIPQQPIQNKMMIMPQITQPFQPSYQPLFIPQQVMYKQPIEPLIMPKQERRMQHQYVDPTQFNIPQQQMYPQEQEYKIKSNQNGNQEILDGFLNFDTNQQQQQQQLQQQQYQQQQQQQQRQDWDTFWSGFMFRSKSHKVGVDAKCLEPEAPIAMAPQIQVNYKGNFTDAKKSANEAFKFILCPSDCNQNAAFQEYIDYFSEKNKIGVAYIGNSILYLLPPNEITNSILPIQGLEILALYIEDKKKIVNYNQDHIL